MSHLLEHLSKDTLPIEMVREFVDYCVWQQAKPALIQILQETQLDDLVELISAATDVEQLAAVSRRSGNTVHETRKRTELLGLSTAEAALFLVSRMATAATEQDWDPEGVAFYAAQACGWAGFAESTFTDVNTKTAAEDTAQQQQEAYLTALWEKYSHSHSQA